MDIHIHDTKTQKLCEDSKNVRKMKILGFWGLKNANIFISGLTH